MFNHKTKISLLERVSFFTDKKIFFIVIVGIIFNGCAAKRINLYEGDERHFSEIAKLDCASSIKIISIDGNSDIDVYSHGGFWYKGCDIRLLPGRHTVSFFYTASSAYSSIASDEVNLSFDAEAGYIYKINYDYKFKDRKFYFRIDEIGFLNE